MSCAAVGAAAAGIQPFLYAPPERAVDDAPVQSGGDMLALQMHQLGTLPPAGAAVDQIAVSAAVRL